MIANGSVVLGFTGHPTLVRKVAPHTAGQRPTLVSSLMNIQQAAGKSGRILRHLTCSTSTFGTVPLLRRQRGEAAQHTNSPAWAAIHRRKWQKKRRGISFIEMSRSQNKQCHFFPSPVFFSKSLKCCILEREALEAEVCGAAPRNMLTFTFLEKHVSLNYNPCWCQNVCSLNIYQPRVASEARHRHLEAFLFLCFFPL